VSARGRESGRAVWCPHCGYKPHRWPCWIARLWANIRAAKRDYRAAPPANEGERK